MLADKTTRIGPTWTGDCDGEGRDKGQAIRWPRGDPYRTVNGSKKQDGSSGHPPMDAGGMTP